MKVLVVEPMTKPYVKEINGSLEEMQAIVGGYIEGVYCFPDVVLVCNDEGKLLGLPFNRALRYEDTGEVYDIVCGTFFIAGLGEEDFDSLTDEQIEKYTDMYSREMACALW